MVVDVPTAYKIVKSVLKYHEGRNTVRSSLKCGVITGISTFGACLLLGPVGVMAGATIGSTVAYATYKDKFKPLSRVIEEDMSEEDRQKLINDIEVFISKLDRNDLITLIISLQGNMPCGKSLLLSRELFEMIKLFIQHWREENFSQQIM